MPSSEFERALTRDGPSRADYLYIWYPHPLATSFPSYISGSQLFKKKRYEFMSVCSRPPSQKFKNFDQFDRYLFLSTKKIRKAAHVFCSCSSKFLKYLQIILLPFCSLAKMSITGTPCWILCSFQTIQQPQSCRVWIFA
jgi:hypothetical protein